MTVQRVSIALMLCVWISLLVACGGAGNTGAKADREPEKGSNNKEVTKSALRTPWAGKLGIGPTAYDELPEPWKQQFTDGWKTELHIREDAVKSSRAALAKLNTSFAKAKVELEKFEERYKDSIRQKEPLTIQVHKERKAALAKAPESIKTAELAVSAAEERLAFVQKNDPPFFPQPYSDCATLRELQDRIVTVEEKN